MDLVLTGRAIDARLAERIGMVGSVVPPRRLLAEADRLARRLSSMEEELVTAVKRLVWRGGDLGMEPALGEERGLAARIAAGGRGKAK
jgi:enoyl-CoA hydratase/carnithine racemase